MEISNKIKSVKLCLMAHPDNEQDSEFADRISDLEDIEKAFSKYNEMLEMLTYLSETMREFDRWRDEYNKIKRLIKESTEL